MAFEEGKIQTLSQEDKEKWPKILSALPAPLKCRDGGLHVRPLPLALPHGLPPLPLPRRLNDL